MNILDRIKQLPNTEDAHWDWRNNRLIVYYSGSLNTIQVLVADAIAKTEMQRAIETITFIG